MDTLLQQPLWGLMAAKWLWWIFKERCTKVAGLRVVDASIFPDAVSAAPNSTIIMAAEKISDQIKKTI
jgi:GMC oxidoreductase